MKKTWTDIYMKNVPGKPNHRELTKPLPCEMYDGSVEDIPVKYQWDGSSVPWIFTRIFPRLKHPVNSCKHDWRREHSSTYAEYAWSDSMFREGVSFVTEETGRKDRAVAWIEGKIGFIGVALNSLGHRIRNSF